jgi:hypothetical protein
MYGYQVTQTAKSDDSRKCDLQFFRWSRGSPSSSQRVPVGFSFALFTTLAGSLGLSFGFCVFFAGVCFDRFTRALAWGLAIIVPFVVIFHFGLWWLFASVVL